MFSAMIKKEILMIALLLTILMIYSVIGVGVGIILFIIEPKSREYPQGYQLIMMAGIFWPWIIISFLKSVFRK